MSDGHQFICREEILIFVVAHYFWWDPLEFIRCFLCNLTSCILQTLERVINHTIFLSNISRTFFKKMKWYSRFVSNVYFGHKCTTISQLFSKQVMNINILRYYFTPSWVVIKLANWLGCSIKGNQQRCCSVCCYCTFVPFASVYMWL